MKKFAAFLVFLAAAYYLYNHQEILKKYVWGDHSAWATPTPADTPDAAADANADTGTKVPMAWKMVARNGFGPFGVVVALVDGNQWRMEGTRLGSLEMSVLVCNGSTTVSKPHSAADEQLDPRPLANLIFTLTSKVAAAAKKIAPQSTEQMDGLTCWKFTEMLGGAWGQYWIDSNSGFLVCYNGTFSGKQTEIHFTKLQADFASSAGEYFNTDNTLPMFANYLVETATPAPLGTSAAPTRYFLKAPFSVTTTYGTMTIPAKTEVRILRQAGDVWHVSGGGSEFDIQPGQLSNSRE